MIEVNQIEPERVPPGNGRPLVDGEKFLRTSSVAKALSDESGLKNWLLRVSATGLAQNKDLVKAIRANPEGDNRALDALVDEAIRRGGGTDARTRGTDLHRVLEMLLQGDGISRQREDLRLDAQVTADRLASAGLTPLMSEVFTAMKRIKVAGSFDYLVEDSDPEQIAPLILDFKSGGPNSKRPLEWSIQLAIYAWSRPFCAEKGYRPWSALGVKAPSKEVAIVAHTIQGSGECVLYRIDIREGWERAKFAMKLREKRSVRGLAKRIRPATKK